MFYKTKGHLASKETIEGMFDSYFRRAWGNHEFSVDYRTEGFEEAWKKWKKIHLK